MVRRLFLTPDETPVSTYNRCLAIPANRAWLAAVNQALLILTNPANWEQLDETDLTPEESAAAAYEMYVAYLSAECGADMNCQDVYNCLSPYAALPANAQVRVNAGVPQYSLDGGVTWSDLENPGTNGTPRVPSRVVTEGSDKLCLAATRAMMVLAEFYKQTAGAVAADLMNTGNAIFNFLNAFTNAGMQFFYSPYDGLLDSLLFDPIELPTDFADGELDSDAKHYLTCLLLANASDDGGGIVSFDFQAVYDNVISELGVNPGTAVTLLLGYIGEAGLNRAGDVRITDTPDCECGAWEIIITDFTGWTITRGSLQGDGTILRGDELGVYGIAATKTIDCETTTEFTRITATFVMQAGKTMPVQMEVTAQNLNNLIARANRTGTFTAEATGSSSGETTADLLAYEDTGLVGDNHYWTVYLTQVVLAGTGPEPTL